jgi:C1A family cysteine protease
MSDQHFYGYKKDPEDPRDFVYHAVHQSKEQLPTSVDLRKYCSPVRDQGQLGSCTGFSMATGLREFLEIKNTNKLTVLSPLFLYYEERKLEGTVKQDAGAYIRDGMKVLATLGCTPERYQPYVISNYKKAPTKTALKNAPKYKITSYARINTLMDMKSSLAINNAFVFGFDVYESFESQAVANTGKVPMPKNGEQLLGGHAVLAVGYKDDPSWQGGGYMIVKNSWSTSWGDQGYFYMPYAYMASDMVSDVWTASK